jgi:hypothetical protein
MERVLVIGVMRIPKRLSHFKRKRYWILNNGTEGSGRLGLWVQQLPEGGNISGGVYVCITANTIMLYFRFRKKTKIL